MTNWKATNVVSPVHGLPVIARPDVVVAGGGAAGVAAAATAAGQGLNVMLIERYGFCGGNAVAGLSGTICGMFLATESDNRPAEQVVFGFTDTFYRAMQSAGGVTPPQRYGKTWTVTHDPQVWREVAEALLLEQGVSVLYHALIVGVIREDDTIRGLVVATKSGLGAIEAGVTIDATGDADVLCRAGLDFTLGDNGHVQNPTMIFRLGGVDVSRFLDYWGPDTICAPEVTQMIRNADESGRYDLPRSKIWLFATPRAGELMCNATRVVGRDGRELRADRTEDLTEAEIAGRLQVREYARFLRDHIPGCEASFVNDTGVQAGIRQSRSAVGVSRLRNEDVTGKRKVADGIARSPWPIELHSGDRPKLEWLIDDYYEVPYGTLVPVSGEAVLVTGRCLSAEHEALASARVTAQCFQYGQAAALAAAESLRTRTPLRSLEGAWIRELMNKDGARLDD
jgi:glycine/D-amino acid oxidase-like deaminating enzyme